MNTEQSMAQHIATVVMGWAGPIQSPTATGIYDYYFSDTPAPYPITRVSDWDPLTNAEQAFEALDNLKLKFPEARVNIRVWSKTKCGVQTEYGGMWHSSGWEDNLLHAICIAICRATGYQEGG